MRSARLPAGTLPPSSAAMNPLWAASSRRTVSLNASTLDSKRLKSSTRMRPAQGAARLPELPVAALVPLPVGST